MAAAGVLLLAVFVARSGSLVAVSAALVIAGVLASAAVIGTRRAGGAARAARRRLPPPTVPAGDRPRPAPAKPPDAGPARLPAGRAVVAPAPPLLPEPPVGPGTLREVATRIAQHAVDQLGAPASVVLVARQGKLAAAGSAGDWSAARQALKHLATPGLYDAAFDDGAPPEFVLDPRGDTIQRMLVALSAQPVPLERWQELEDVPGPLLPLVGLAAAGAGVAVALAHRRQLAGLWLLAQRPGDRRYSDSELAALRQLALASGPALGEALAAGA
jgi:hypothetical protein